MNYAALDADLNNLLIADLYSATAVERVVKEARRYITHLEAVERCCDAYNERLDAMEDDAELMKVPAVKTLVEQFKVIYERNFPRPDTDRDVPGAAE